MTDPKIHSAAPASAGHRSRKDSQAQTRLRLIAVARTHFLRDGLGGAIVEKIAEEAGYTRGALYANFAGKEELFLAVVRSSVDSELEHFRSILASHAAPAERLSQMRQAFGDLVFNPGWVLLEAEFQANALRSKTVRSAYLQHLERRIQEGARLLQQFAEQLGIELSGPPEDVAMVLGSLAEGLAVRLAIAPPTDPQRTRELAMRCFDQIISATAPNLAR